MCVAVTFRYVYGVSRRKTGGHTTLTCTNFVRRVHTPTGSYHNRFVCSFPTHSTRYGHAAGNDVWKRARGKAIGKAAASSARVNGVPLTTMWAGWRSLYSSPPPKVRIDAAACTGVGVRPCSLSWPSRVRVGRRTGRAYGGGGRDVPRYTRLCDSPCPPGNPLPPPSLTRTQRKKNYCHPLYYPSPLLVHVVGLFGTRLVANIFYYPINLYPSLFFFFWCTWRVYP